MDLKQVTASLSKLFHAPLDEGEHRKIVFWTDMDEEFVNDYESISLEGVKTIHLHENNQFYVKHLLEEEDQENSYLIYTNIDLQDRNNWLYDTVLYSRTFYADRLSLIMEELGITNSLRPVVQTYEKFFKRQERVESLKALNIDRFTKENLEIAMMNVICGQKSLNFEPVLRAVLMDTLDDEANRYLADFDRYFDTDTFWDYTAYYYDYRRDEPTLKTLLMHLTMTAFSQTIDHEHLDNYTHFIAEYNSTNCFVFIDHWMHHTVDNAVYHDYIMEIEDELQLSVLLDNLSVETYQNADVFPGVDRAVILHIANGLLDQREDYDRYLSFIQTRRSKHFYNTYRYLYNALFYAVKMSKFKKHYTNSLSQGYAIDIFKAYTNDYYRMDTYYRKFYVAYDAEGDSEILQKIKPLVEKLYTNWFTGELNTYWSQVVNEEMTDEWKLPGINNQQHFYQNVIQPHVNKDERVFVIISDAMRFEIGKELKERINSEIMGSSQLDALLSVVPSVTKIGMASLLPHKTLDIDEKGNVLVNQESTAGVEGRGKILSKYSDANLAIQAEDIFKNNKAQRREIFKGKKLIYIYHDTIDAYGDDADTEITTFDAAEKAMDQLSDLVRIIRNDLSGTNIYITADHGFLYEREELTEVNYIPKDSVNPFEISRRYILSSEQRDVDGLIRVNLSSIIKNDQNLNAYMPNATMRYRIKGGGANFVHGGASLQEVAVPLLTVQNKRTGQSGAKAVEKVSINLTSTTRRITNSMFSLEFFQDEKAVNKYVPRTVVVYMVDEADTILSNEETIIGDMTSDNPKERVFKLQFSLKNMAYDRNQTYYLIIKDTETDVITDKIPFRISLGFINEFDF